MGIRGLGCCSIECREGSGHSGWAGGVAGAVESKCGSQMGCSNCGVDRLDRDYTGCNNVRLGGDRCISSQPECGTVLNDEGKEA